jgi:hypothetical protein
VSRPVPEPTQPPAQWAVGHSDRGVKLTTDFYLVPILRIRRTRQSFLSTTSCCGAHLSTGTTLRSPYNNLADHSGRASKA